MPSELNSRDSVRKKSLCHRLFLSAFLGLCSGLLCSGLVAIFLEIDFQSRSVSSFSPGLEAVWMYLGRFFLEFPLVMLNKIVHPFAELPHEYVTWGIWGFSGLLCILSWVIVGILLGLLFCSWSERPFRQFIRLHLFVFFGLFLIWGLYGVDSLLNANKPNMTAPSNYHPPCFELPSGFQRKQLSDLELQQLQKGEQLTVVEQKLGSYEFSLSQTVGNKAYRIHYSSSQAWPYVFQERTKEQNTWRTLGPFLPGLGASETVKFSPLITITMISNGRLQWLIQKDSLENEKTIQKVGAKNNLTWLCSMPIELYQLDRDKDGLNEMEEAARLTRPDQADTDGDGISDKNDLSPHGWFLDTRSISLIAQKLVNQRIKNVDFPLPPMAWLPTTPPWQIDSGATTVFTLEKEASDEIRLRSGMGIFHIEHIHRPEYRTYFNGAFGVVTVGSTWGGKASHGNIAMYWRFPFGRWRELFFKLLSIS